jgi:hypothetical protein
MAACADTGKKTGQVVAPIGIHRYWTIGHVKKHLKAEQICFRSRPARAWCPHRQTADAGVAEDRTSGNHRSMIGRGRRRM